MKIEIKNDASPAILKKIAGTPWLILESSLKEIIEIADRQNDIEAVVTKLGRPLQNTRKVEVRDGGVAIVPIAGPIFRYANMFTEISGATAIDTFAKDLQAAIDNEAIKTIILNVDSPGGEVGGIAEMAQMIFNAREKKNIIAYVDGYAASAAYWIASAASKMVISSTAIVGSIGVVVTMQDDSQSMDKKGVKVIELVSTQSPNKRPDITTDEGKKTIIQTLDALATVFIDAVAKQRGVTAEVVQSDFGKGGVFVGQDAVNRNMADQVGTFEGLIEGLQKNKLEVNNIMGEENTAIEKSKINADFIKAEFPEVANALICEGKEVEMKRIQGVEEKLMPGHEKLISEMKFDGQTEPAEAAERILAAEKSKIQKLAEVEKVEAAKVPEVDSESKNEDDATTEAAISGMAAGIMSRQGKIGGNKE